MAEDSEEGPLERTTVAFKPKEMAAVKWMLDNNPKYTGIPSVLRDYSLDDLVAFHQRALQTAVSA